MERLVVERNSFQTRSGFTLVELLVALFIFVFAVGAALATLHASAQITESSRNRMLALQDANAVMEELKAVGLMQVSNINTVQFRSQVLNDEGVLVDALTNEAITITTNPPVITGSTTLATATVTVAWEDIGGRASSLAVSTQKSSY